MTIDLVVSHYNEDLGWLGSLPEVDMICLYTKADVPPKCNIARVTQLRNEGREAGTYLYHITERYYELADVTLFLQGDALSHCAHERLAEQIVTLQKEGLPTGFRSLTRGHTQDDRHGKPNHWQTDLPVGAIYERTFRRAGPEAGYYFGPGACFAAGKNAIQSKPFLWWQDLYMLCKIEYPALYPWTMERLWPYMICDEL